MKIEVLSIVKRLFYYMTLLVTVLLTACSSDETINNEEPLPEGMGRIRITICAPEVDGTLTTRAVEEDPDDPNKHEYPWETPDHDWEILQTFRVYICDASNKVVQIIEGKKSEMTVSTESGSTYKYVTKTSEPLAAGTYHIFATANFHSSDASTNQGNANDEYDDGYAVGATINPNATKPFANSSCYYIVGEGKDDLYKLKNIPMTGWLSKTESGSLTPKPIGVSNGVETDAGTITLWRVIGKMQFEFTNESDRDIKILGIEVDPINKASNGIYLFSKDNLESEANLAPGTGVTLPEDTKTDMGPVSFVPPTVSSQLQPLVLAAKNDGDTDQGKIYFYVNESDGTFTTTNNQYSLRFKVQRKKTNNSSDDTWYDEEIRYGVTTHHSLSNAADDPYGGTKGGFNVIRRNDWIHIPIILTDWQFRIEPLALVPIAGYPAKTVSSDGLTATFSTGGYIILQPFVKKYSDATWRDFSDPEITYGKDRANWTASIHWKNKDGDNQYGDECIVKTAFAYDEVNHCIVGELNNAAAVLGHNYMTTFTIEVTLGPENDTSKQYGYSFTFNVVLQ